jgi:exonuclease VII large subunit
MYFNQDKRHLLKYVKEVIPSSEEDWEKIEKLFNNKYVILKKQPIRTLNSIKTKFKEITHNALTKSGEKDEFEKKMKELQKEIDKKCEIINGALKNNKSDIETSESKITSIKPKNSLGRPTKMNFEKHVMSYISQQAKIA